MASYSDIRGFAFKKSRRAGVAINESLTWYQQAGFCIFAARPFGRVW